MSFSRIDQAIVAFVRRSGAPAARISVGIIFFWFGILKPFGISPAAPIVLATAKWLPMFQATTWLAVIGWWEVAIGVLFLAGRGLRVAIALLALQMSGTLMPLFVLPEVTWQPGRVPYAPTMEGQYIIKNLLIISAALVVGGTVARRGDATET